MCLSTGDEAGMIELVLNAETVSGIQLTYGGSTAAFRDTPLSEWIRSHNPDRAFRHGRSCARAPRMRADGIRP